MITKTSKENAQKYIKGRLPDEILLDEEDSKQYFWHLPAPENITIEYFLTKDKDEGIYEEGYHLINEKPMYRIAD